MIHKNTKVANISFSQTLIKHWKKKAVLSDYNIRNLDFLTARCLNFSILKLATCAKQTRESCKRRLFTHYVQHTGIAVKLSTIHYYLLCLNKN